MSAIQYLSTPPSLTGQGLFISAFFCKNTEYSAEDTIMMAKLFVTGQTVFHEVQGSEREHVLLQSAAHQILLDGLPSAVLYSSHHCAFSVCVCMCACDQAYVWMFGKVYVR